MLEAGVTPYRLDGNRYGQGRASWHETLDPAPIDPPAR